MARSRERIFDEYLASAARAGDRPAFAHLAARWQPKLLAHAWRLTGDPELARDVVQDAWADIMKGLRRLDDAAAFPAWAFRIVTRRAADNIRRAQRRRKLNSVVAHERRNDVQPADSMEHNADAATIRFAIDALPKDQRAAIALFYLQDLSVAEIAAALEVPAGTVKTRLMHARRKLRAALEGGKSDGRAGSKNRGSAKRGGPRSS